MDSNFSLLIIIALLTTSWYYYMKYKEYEKEITILNNNVTKMNIENTNYRVRIKDLQKYKNDVSKTFKILDNELVHINNHVEKNNQQLQSQQTQLPIPQLQNQPNRINLLTPDMLNNLIENMNQELTFFNPQSELINGLSVSQDTPNNTSPIMQFSQEQDQQEQQQQQEQEPSQQHEEQEPSQQHEEQEPSHEEQEQQREPSFVEETRNTLSNLLQSNNGTSIFRSMSFPNLPSAYQRLMIPISDSVISRMSNPSIGNEFSASTPVPIPSLQTTDN